HVMAGIPGGLFDRRRPAKHDEVGEADLLAASAAPSKSALMPSSTPSTRASLSGSLTAQSFCGARRRRAPLAPPRLSEPRKVEAEAQAVLTSWLTLRPESAIRP